MNSCFLMPIETKTNLIQGGDDFQLSFEANGLTSLGELEVSQCLARTRQSSMWSGTTESTVPFDNVEYNWSEDQYSIDSDPNNVLDKYLWNTPSMYGENIYIHHDPNYSYQRRRSSTLSKAKIQGMF